MNFKILQISGLVALAACCLLVLASGCEKTVVDNNSGDNGGGNGNPQESFKYIKCKITCGNPPQPTVAGVMIFDEATGQRLVSGSSLPNGEFCSLDRLSTRGSYRIEFYELPNSTCVLWVRSITYQDNAIWFRASCNDAAIAPVHFGGQCSGMPEVTDCWGG